MEYEPRFVKDYGLHWHLDAVCISHKPKFYWVKCEKCRDNPSYEPDLNDNRIQNELELPDFNRNTPFRQPLDTSETIKPSVYVGLCILCNENTDLKYDWYNNPNEVHTRIMLKETNKTFTLVGYKYNSYDDKNKEYWRCEDCSTMFDFNVKSPGVIRDQDHEIVRWIHRKYWCDSFKTKKITFQYF